jgi:hypothetical protein
MGLVSKSSGVGPHLASMVVVAGRSWRGVRLERRETG